jgi:hypothetical protein
MSECFEVDFLPVGENSCSGDAICLRYGSPQTGYNINIVDGGYASTTEAIVGSVATALLQPFD